VGPIDDLDDMTAVHLLVSSLEDHPVATARGDIIAQHLKQRSAARCHAQPCATFTFSPEAFFL
jgi:hypothetical protein